MATYPVFLLVKISSEEQYSRPTPSGILYLALKPSISADESTSFSSLPIPLTLGDVKKVYLGKEAGKGNGGEKLRSAGSEDLRERRSYTSRVCKELAGNPHRSGYGVSNVLQEEILECSGTFKCFF